jgi:hypothetical protein
MPQPSDSFKQFNYSLRPSKQVERRMMIEVLSRLSSPRFPISSYRYLGMGSIYYVDFVLFHKHLFIEDMICIEWSDIPKRMVFNKPFKFIKLRLQPLSGYIPRIARTKLHLAWLDYDRPLDPDMLQDIDGCLRYLAPKSVFVVTIDARPKLPPDAEEVRDIDLATLTAKQREELVVTNYRKWFGPYLEAKITRLSVSGTEVATLFHAVVAERIRETLANRQLRFIQLFNYVYRDGAPMLTVGGMIGTEEDDRFLRDTGILGHRFVRTSSDYMTISVPPLTIREKYWLDSQIDAKLAPNMLDFELDEDLLNNYREFYKEYPTYMESVL